MAREAENMERTVISYLICLGCSQEATQSKEECLSIRLMEEQEAALFHQQVVALRQALARAQADNLMMCEQQESQVSGPRSSSSLTLSAPCRAGRAE